MNHPASDAFPSDLDRLDRLDRRRAGAKMGWYVHASVYVLVNLALAGLSAARGHAGAIQPLLGWGLGLLVHGAVVWFAASGSGLRERLVARERRALGDRDRA